MVSVRLAPTDSKIYLRGDSSGMAGELLTHLLAGPPHQGPLPPPQGFQELALLAVEQTGHWSVPDRRR